MATLISRPRLLEAIGAQPANHWLIEAGGGFGKTVLASQLRSHVTSAFVVVWSVPDTRGESDLVTALAAACTGAGFSLASEVIASAGSSAPALAAAIGDAGPAVVVLDGVQEWDNAAQTLLAQIISHSQSHTRYVLLTRSLSGPLRALSSHPEVMVLTVDHLAFTQDEIVRLIEARDARLAPASEVLAEVTDGWPVAVHLLLERLASADNWGAELAILGSTPEPASAVLQRYIGDLSPNDREMMLTLAALPAFDEGLVRAGGAPGLLARLLATGLPLAQRFDDRWEFCGAVRDLLLIHSASRPGVNRDLVRYLIDRRDIRTALDYCLNVGAHDLAAEVIASLQIRDDVLLDLPTMNRAMSVIGTMAHETPRALLVQARANLSAMQFDVGLDALETAQRCFERIDPQRVDPDHLETSMDLALQYGFMERVDEASALIDLCKPSIGTRSSVARAIMLEAQSAITAADQSDSARREAEKNLTEAIGIWKQVNEPRGAMAATMNLVNNVLLFQGRYADALDVLDAAAELRPVSIMNRARTALARGTILPLLGRAVEARDELDRAVRLAESIGQEWLAGWAWWKLATLHSLGGDDEAFVEALEAGRVMAGEALDHPMWLILHSGAVEDWLRSGRSDKVARAAEHVAAMERVAGEAGWDPTYARWLLDARCLDAAEAVRAAPELLNRAEIPRDRRWLIEFYVAFAHHRLGDGDSSIEWQEQAIASARALGIESVVELVARDMVVELAGDARCEASTVPPAASFDAPVEITLFGRFAVHVNGQPLELPTGHVSNVVKLLAIEGAPTHAEVLIDRLWPDVDARLGRKRLRNVLLRARNAGADYLQRHGDLVALDESVQCDLWRVRTGSRAALAATDHASSIALCERVLESLAARLLPEDRYEDWAEQARSEVTKLQLALHDHSAALHVAAGAIEAAVASLQRGSELDPLPNDRLQRCARLLRDVGRSGAAAQFERG